MNYKAAPFSAALSNTEDASHLAAQVESIISRHASDGWEYVGRIERLLWPWGDTWS